MIRGLDGLRALAVLLVVLFHANFLDVGWIGVQVFFVLSGFLITRILLEARAAPLGRYLRTFYGRRTLRIFPVYYLYLVVLAGYWLLRNGHSSMIESAAGSLPYAFSYTYDLFHASSSFVHSKFLTHFWSLAVEEQFYLVWPMLIYLVPRSLLPRFLLAVAASGPLIRFITMAAIDGWNAPVYRVHELALYVLPWTHLDAFATGALLLVCPVTERRRALALAVILFCLAGAYGRWTDPHSMWSSLGFPLPLAAGRHWLLGYTVVNVLAAAMLACIAKGEFLASLFENRMVLYLGRISYGIYIFHYPVQAAVQGLTHWSPIIQLPLQLALTVAVAGASYRWFELPILRFKDRWFPAAHECGDSISGAALTRDYDLSGLKRRPGIEFQ